MDAPITSRIPDDCLFIICCFCDSIQTCANMRLINHQWNDYLTEEDDHFHLFYTTQFKSLLLIKKRRLEKYKDHGNKLENIESQLRGIELRDRSRRKLRLNQSVLIHRLQYLYFSELYNVKLKSLFVELKCSVPKNPFPQQQTTSGEVMSHEYWVNLFYDRAETYINSCENTMRLLPQCIKCKNKVDLFIRSKHLKQVLRHVTRVIFHSLGQLVQYLYYLVPFHALFSFEKYEKYLKLISDFLHRLISIVYDNEYTRDLNECIQLPLSYIISINDPKLVNYCWNLRACGVDESTLDHHAPFSNFYFDYRVASVEMINTLMKIPGASSRIELNSFTFICVHNPLSTIKHLINLSNIRKSGQHFPLHYLDTVLRTKVLSEDKVQLVEYLLSVQRIYSIEAGTLSSFWEKNNQQIHDLLIKYNQIK
jgi:hypothetical protein